MQKTQKLSKNDYFFIFMYFTLSSFILGLVYHEKKQNVKPNYTEISSKDMLSLVNDTIYLNKKNNFKTTILHIYQPIQSVSQTIDATLIKSTKCYRFYLSEINIVPKIVEVRINRVKVSIQNHYELKKDARLLSLKFQEIKHSESKLNYQFAFNEFGNYQDFGNENTLNIHLPNGKLNLYIRAVNFKHKLVTKYYKISIHSKIPFTKKPWFWPIMTLLALFPFVFYYFRLKLNRQKSLFEQQLALEKQRSKITADLHDEIGSSLSSLQINSAVATFLLENNPTEAQKILAKIEAQSESLSDKIGDIIWSMKPGKEEFLTLTSRIKNFANEILGDTEINYKIKIDKKIDTLITDISARKNIVLFIKEAINNAAKYSKAKQLQVTLKINNKQVEIEISDNGVGFDTSIVKGNGLGNMQKRIEELKGQFSITSELNLGTKVKATIPVVP